MKTTLIRSFLCTALLSAGLWLTFASAPVTRANNDKRAPELPSPLCDSVEVPAGHKVAYHVYAKGVQIYRWDGASWKFVAPEADLFADAEFHGKVGRHYAGPTWESNAFSKVIGSRVGACTPDATAIAWLKLKAVTTTGPGIFHKVTFIQRVNTVGGLAPTTPGTTADEIAEVPYTTEYYFYRAEN